MQAIDFVHFLIRWKVFIFLGMNQLLDRLVFVVVYHVFLNGFDVYDLTDLQFLQLNLGVDLKLLVNGLNFKVICLLLH